MHFFFILLAVIAIPGFGQPNSIFDLEKTAVLERFFQVLTEESELGYVLYNKKPVCIHGFYYKDPFRVDTLSHKQSVALREGARIWSQVNKDSSDLLLHICDKEDPLIPGYIHVLGINVPLFHRAVNENLTLFQYVLGPAAHSESMLKSLLSNSCGFHSLLKNDKVLIGKVLGFGMQNSLYVSRMENIQEALSCDIPPFLHGEKLVYQSDKEFLPFAPSFGFTSMNQELEDFQQKTTLSSDKLLQQNPEFVFGWVSTVKEASRFIADLENTQSNIQKLIASPHFLETMLEKFVGREEVLPSKEARKYTFPITHKEVNKIVARGIWESLQSYDYEFLPSFIEGFDLLLSPGTVTVREAWFPHYCREMANGKKNLEIAEKLFSALDKDFLCLIPQKLYFRTISQGTSGVNLSGSFASITYTILSPQGHSLAQQINVPINLKNTIPGFAHGVMGMELGETREILIHPSLAYGFYTSLEPCIYLRALVTLTEIHNQIDTISPATFLDLSFLSGDSLLLEREENYRKALREKGAQIARHLKKCGAVDLPLITSYLNQFYHNKESPNTSQEEQDLINQIHWNIYYGS